MDKFRLRALDKHVTQNLPMKKAADAAAAPPPPPRPNRKARRAQARFNKLLNRRMSKGGDITMQIGPDGVPHVTVKAPKEALRQAAVINESLDEPKEHVPLSPPTTPGYFQGVEEEPAD
jgi:hypothetical protein